MNQSTRRISLAIFASGTGSNAQKIIDYFRDHALIQVTLIICNKPGAGVLHIAEKEKIPHLVIDKQTFRETGYAHVLNEYGINWIILAGFLWKVPQVLVKAFPGRIINIHPALLPLFGGKGMYGMAVHLAVIMAKQKQSGITIHIIDEEYDRGEIIFQQAIDLAPDETAETLAQKIHELEYRFFAPTIERNILK